MTATKSALSVNRKTARELLALVAGEEHALHSAASRTVAARGAFTVECSCGARFSVPVSAESEDAFRNVLVKVVS